MSQEIRRQEAPSGLRADALADSVVILLVLTVVQRGVGFCRAMLFCRWLDPEQLGEWEIAFGFFLLAGPLVVLALPAAFGRYVEHFRQKGQLRTFLRRTAMVCGVLSMAACLALVLAREWFSQLLFDDAKHGWLIVPLAASLLAVVGFNYVTELLTALRTVRLSAVLQFVNGIAFAVLGIALVLGVESSAVMVVVAYGGACLISIVVATGWLSRMWPSLADDGPSLPHRVLWQKIVPFAFWIWCGNLLGNLFEIVDRYMILYLMPLDHEAALGVVGQYHSARVIPALLLSIATLLGAIVTPHLSSDWEAGRRERVSTRLNMFLKLLSLALVAAGIVVLAAAPLLFRVALRAKFPEGQAVLPWTVLYSIWFGLAAVAQNYLWCAEKARWGSVALGVGLVVNIVLNLLLLPRYGLLGTVMATSAAHAVVLALVCTLDWAAGFRIDRRTCLVLALPVVLCLGPGTAAALVSIVLLDGLVSDRLFSPDEKALLSETFAKYVTRVRETAAVGRRFRRATS